MFLPASACPERFPEGGKKEDREVVFQMCMHGT